MIVLLRRVYSCPFKYGLPAINKSNSQETHHISRRDTRCSFTNAGRLRKWEQFRQWQRYQGMLDTVHTGKMILRNINQPGYFFQTPQWKRFSVYISIALSIASLVTGAIAQLARISAEQQRGKSSTSSHIMSSESQLHP